jgi:DNA-binding CsgD family transcriptional regulator
VLAPVLDRTDLKYLTVSMHSCLLAAARAEADAAALARALHNGDALEASRGAVDTVQAVARRIDFPSPLVQALRTHPQAELARWHGDHDPEPWRQALSTKPHLAHERAWALYRLAEAQCHSVGRESAAGSLREAHTAAAKLCARRLIDEIGALATRARIDLDPSLAGSPTPTQRQAFGLTDREREVLALLTEGYTNAQLADRLFISPKTASVHVSRILTKLNVTSRTQAAVIAYRVGLTSTSTRSDR